MEKSIEHSPIRSNEGDLNSSEQGEISRLNLIAINTSNCLSSFQIRIGLGFVRGSLTHVRSTASADVTNNPD
jgi:hypothetical protein